MNKNNNNNKYYWLIIKQKYNINNFKYNSRDDYMRRIKITLKNILINKINNLIQKIKIK